jgi:Acetyltransferase (GNAT) family.
MIFIAQSNGSPPPPKNGYSSFAFVFTQLFKAKVMRANWLDFAEDKLRNQGCLSVRLDTFSKNVRNQKLYEARGYQRLGDVYFEQKSEHPFHCYELVF